MSRTCSISAMAVILLGVLVLGVVDGRAAYPDKPITIIVPWVPGGASDVVARTVAKPMSEELKQPVLIVNKPGAAGVTGTLDLERSVPDGYTLGTYSFSQALTQYTSPNPVSLANVVPISTIMTSFATLSVGGNQPWNTLKEFLDYARANPGKIRNSNSGKGASAHIMAEAFDRETGIKQTHVPFGGYAPAVSAVAGGHIEATCIPIGDVQAMARAGKIKILAVAAEERYSQFPNVPTMKELKINLVIDNWVGLMAPKGTPLEIIEVIDRAVEKSMKRPEVIKLFQEAGNTVIYRNHKVFTEWLKGHDAYLKSLTESLGLRVAPKK
jgi:tripartite-type tricarboxylate transporter receptor subunit TctC